MQIRLEAVHFAGQLQRDADLADTDRMQPCPWSLCEPQTQLRIVPSQALTEFAPIAPAPNHFDQIARQKKEKPDRPKQIIEKADHCDCGIAGLTDCGFRKQDFSRAVVFWRTHLPKWRFRKRFARVVFPKQKARRAPIIAGSTLSASSFSVNRSPDLVCLIRRIGKNNIEVSWSRAERARKVENILLPHTALQLRLCQIFFDSCNRLPIFVHEKRGRGASTQCFNAKRAAAGKKIEHPRVDNRVAQTGKNGRLHPVHRWADAGSGHRQPDTAGATGDHPHGEGPADAASVTVAHGAGDGVGGSAGEHASGFVPLRSPLFATQKTVKKILEIVSDHFFQQVGLWPIDRAAHLEVDRKIAGLIIG